MLSGQLDHAGLEAHWNQHFEDWERNGRILPEDSQVLKRVPPQQRSFFSWSLVSQELISTRPLLCTSDGQADVMAYDRLCDLVQAGVAGVSNVRTAAAFQMPYIYVHLLAFMIHFVNVLTAVGTGVRVGLILAKGKQGHGVIDMNELVNAMIFLVVQAFIYQAFLTIGAALSFPITGSAYRVPLKSMCVALDGQLKLMNYLADNFDKEEVDLDQFGKPGADDEDFG